jgi:hypothetical protein
MNVIRGTGISHRGSVISNVKLKELDIDWGDLKKQIDAFEEESLEKVQETFSNEQQS